MSNLAEIAESQLHAPQYLKAVTELGDAHSLVTTCEVRSSTGIKLVNSGTRFNSSLYRKLLQHKLIPPLDQCLAVDNSVTANDLSENVSTFLSQDTWLQPLQSAVPDSRIFGRVMAQVALHPAIAFKLTVMRESHPDLFQHSIYLALICIYIGIRHGMDSAKLPELATAALLHDIGILHIDPALLERGHNLSEAERRHLYAHPLTAWMVLKECTDYSQEILDAVLQHHERLDGSGYPLGLKNDAISPYGRILAVSEIIASRHGDPNSAFEKIRLEAILKLNSRRYGHQLISYLDVFYRNEADVPACTEINKQIIRNQLESTHASLSSWERLWNSQYRGYRSFEGINQRMQNLRLEILDAGLAPLDVLESMHGLEEVPRTCFEMHILLDEVIWQLHDVLEEIKRRWPELGQEDPASCGTQVLNWVIETERMINPR